MYTQVLPNPMIETERFSDKKIAQLTSFGRCLHSGQTQSNT